MYSWIVAIGAPMSHSSRVPEPRRGRGALSANDQLKERWGRRLAWSIVWAVFLHVLIFSLSPEWVLPPPTQLDRIGGAASGAMAVTQLPAASGLGPAAGGTPVAERPDSTAEERVVEMASGEEKRPVERGAGDGTVYTQDELWDRLDRTARPSLALTDPPEPAAINSDPEPPENGRAGSHGSGPESTIGGRAATVGVVDPDGEDSPALGRLRSLRPEVVTGLASSEVLLRNPRDVVEFKKFAARRRPAVATTSAVIGVAVWVDRNGSVEWAEVSESTGSEVLDETALTLFRRVVAFRPAMESGKRVPKSMLFYILFPW